MYEKEQNINFNNTKPNRRTQLKETNFQRIKVIQLLGNIPNGSIEKTICDWGVRIHYKVGKYSFTVNIPDKLMIQDFTKPGVTYEINLMKNKNKESFVIRSYLAKRPDLVLSITNDSIEFLTTHIARMLHISDNEVFDLLTAIKIKEGNHDGLFKEEASISVR